MLVRCGRFWFGGYVNWRATRLFCSEPINGNGSSSQLLSYSRKIHGAIQQNDLAAARIFFQEMKKLRIKPNPITYTTLIRAHINHKKMDEAIGLAREMTANHYPLEIQHYNDLIDGYVNENKMRHALSLYHQLIKSNIPADSRTYSALIRGFCNNNLEESALSFFLHNAKLRSHTITNNLSPVDHRIVHKRKCQRSLRSFGFGEN